MNISSSRKIFLAALLLLGLAIRLYDLTNPPLDFHPTRQILSLQKARGMYYQTRADLPADERAFAVRQWKIVAAIEPEVLENLVAFTYRFTGEQMWVARVYSSLFWVISALFLFLLAREFFPAQAALAAAAAYLFLPYAVLASRSFQPDPLMVALIVIFWWAAVRWAKKPTSYQWALLAGLVGGFAIYIKFVAAFFVVAGGLGAVLGRESILQAMRRPQLYLMAALGAAPGAAYVIYGVWVSGYLGQQFGGRFMPALFLSPAYYLGWASMLNLVAGAGVLVAALLGLFLARERAAFRFLLALWLGYFVFGLYFNYHISTHDYYSLPLIPILALSLAPLAELLFAPFLVDAAAPRLRLTLALILVGGLFLHLWGIRAQLKAQDFRAEPAKWQEISALFDKDARLVGLVEDYGARMAYFGGRPIKAWYAYGDFYYHENRGAQFNFDSFFAEETAKRDYFIVTDFDELAKLPPLKERLAQYPIAFTGEGYVIYNLQP
ncbi:MAG: hypothetical protein Fur002_09840 [Anaerolineales bacterium]